VFTAGAVLLLLVDGRWMRVPWRRAVRSAAAFAAISAGPLILHFGYVYYKLSDGFLIRVARGNPAPYETFHRPFLSLAYHAGEVIQITSAIVFVIGIAGVAYTLFRRDRLRAWAPLFLLWTPSVINVAALYWGHIYRVRYSVLLLPAAAIFGALLCTSERASRRALTTAAGVVIFLPWLTWYFPAEWRYHGFQPGPGLLFLPICATIAFLAGTAWEHRRWMLLGLGILGMHLPVLAGEMHPIIAETMEHDFIEPERQRILQELSAQYDSTRILVDMGKLAPLVFDSGLPVREFVYNEGSRIHWERALRSPASEVGWICVERGDEFWGALQIDPALTDGYSLAVQTDNLLLYRRTARQRVPVPTTRRLE
jgi:hypothetical protein